MNDNRFSREQITLAVGDVAALLVAVAAGFVTHESTSSFLARFAYTFVPWTLAWLVVAPRWGLFELPQPNWKGLAGRILAAMLVASPLAAVLRAAWLGGTAIPIFALIMGASTALALYLWRLIYVYWWTKR